VISIATEKHYRVKDLAELWGFSDNTIIKQFTDEPGVLRLRATTGTAQVRDALNPRERRLKGSRETRPEVAPGAASDS
jgi:hypothetical protein